MNKSAILQRNLGVKFVVFKFPRTYISSYLRHTAVLCRNWLYLFAIFILSSLDFIVLHNRRFWCTTGQWFMSQLHY